MRLATLLVLWSSLALADAVPPPPRTCPPGQVGVTSHAGPRCVEAAPASCPAGWRPEVGGLCVVHTCDSDDQCGRGKACREADVCLHERLVEWGEASPSRAAPFVFAAPPRHYDPPLRVVDTVDVCDKQSKCPGEATCGKGKVCLPKGVSKPATWTKKQKK